MCSLVVTIIYVNIAIDNLATSKALKQKALFAKNRGLDSQEFGKKNYFAVLLFVWGKSESHVKKYSTAQMFSLTLIATLLVWKINRNFFQIILIK